MQLDFLVRVIKSDYPAVWKTLTTTSSVQAASDAVLLRFERPADTSERVRKLRDGFGETLLAELGSTELPDPETIEGDADDRREDVCGGAGKGLSEKMPG